MEAEEAPQEPPVEAEEIAEVDETSSPHDEAVAEAEPVEASAEKSTPCLPQRMQHLQRSDAEPEPAADAAPDEATLALLAEKEAELERLHMENARLRQSVVGATEVIEELEEPPMPPLVEDNIVIPPTSFPTSSALAGNLTENILSVPPWVPWP